MLSICGISKAFGDTIAIDNFDLKISSGELLVLLGPSGCGKTTLLRIVAGLEVADSGTISIENNECTLWPPQRRNVAMVFQHYALYPHRTVRENIEYPLRVQKLPFTALCQKVESIAEFLGISALLERKPRELSGGEAQRVALARALVREPSCFLMDEPLSNLDAQLRIRARVEIKRIQRSLAVTTIYVTHDQDEAVALGDRVAVMNRGSLVQVGTPEELFRRPATTFVAGFLGRPSMNLISGTVAGDSEGGFAIHLQIVDGPPVVFQGFNGVKLAHNQSVLVGFRPDHIRFGHQNASHGRGELSLSAHIEMVEGLEPNFIAHCQTPVGLILARTSRRPEAGPAHIMLLASQAHLFDAQTGNRIE